MRLYPYFFSGFYWYFYFWVAFSLFGCSALGDDFTRINPSTSINTAQADHNNWSETAAVEEAQHPGPIKTPTAILVLGSDDLGESLGSAVPTTQPDDPIQFVFPTPGPAPVSAWRPPLYPVPWALSPHDHFYFIRPIAANDVNWPLASYRYGYVLFGNNVHTGVDIPNPVGTTVMAAGSGDVVWADYGASLGRHGYLSDPYGLAVLIRHDFGYQGQSLYTLYAHLSEVCVGAGQHVEAGDKIGVVGSTGQSTGPHLHFEIRLGANHFFNSRNPELWMSPPQGWGVLAGRVMDADGSPLILQTVTVSLRGSGEKRTALTYGPKNVNPDSYYNENLALGDLPAGDYVITIEYLGERYQTVISVLPGQINYFSFLGENGFDLSLPAESKVKAAGN